MKKIVFLTLFIFISAFLMPILGPNHVIASAKVKAKSGMLIKGKSLSTIYHFGEDGKRYVFPNSKTYFSWFDDFGQVVEIDDDDLALYPLGGNVRYKPGAILAKIQTDPKVYAVSHNGLLRWIKSEAIARALYGENWNLLVDDIPDSFFVNYTVGDPIDDEEEYDPDEEEEEVPEININRGFKAKNKYEARIAVKTARRCQLMERHINRIQKRLNRWGLEVSGVGNDFYQQCVIDEGDDDDVDDDNDNSGKGALKGKKITICHIPPGSPNNAHTITISKNALKAHLKHGDTLGRCDGDEDDEEDTTPPIISNIQTITGSSSATITWDTDEDSDSVVVYATDPFDSTDATSTKTDSSMTKDHSVTIENLTPTTTYYFIVRSTDASGNQAESSEKSFVTDEEAEEPTPDNTPPIITDIVVNTEATSTTISWTTDEEATSKVEYATDTLSSTTITILKMADSNLELNHELILGGLATSTEYYFRIESKDTENNVATTTEDTFTTEAE